VTPLSKRPVVLTRRLFVVGYVLPMLLIFAALTIGYLKLQDNVAAVQASRLSSCFQTYEGVRDVFRPFFRPPKQRTAKERADIRKFNRTVDELKRRCGRQTEPKEE
jgi:hypothetical protein